jgi:hypothetical protein
MMAAKKVFDDVVKGDDILNENIASTCSHVEVEERYPDIERIGRPGEDFWAAFLVC